LQRAKYFFFHTTCIIFRTSSSSLRLSLWENSTRNLRSTLISIWKTTIPCKCKCWEQKFALQNFEFTYILGGMQGGGFHCSALQGPAVN